ncbi:cyclase family protein [Nocardioides sp. KR10-350]|uniref:cyclase family protein n=1 Tax=Nocardioides cheoyonin TaxID=3156615 RepID=UPI0032B5AE0A
MSTSAHNLPTYQNLPTTPAGDRCTWGIFGASDQVGTINLQTPGSVVSAAREIRRGAVFPLNAGVDEIDPPLFSRQPTRHTLLPDKQDLGFDDLLTINPQASSQWDSLAHVGATQDALYNGVTAEEFVTNGRNSIQALATRGIVGRGVLLDVDGLMSARAQTYSPGDARPISVGDLDEARRRAGVEWRPGDVAVLYTGFLRWYRTLPANERTAMSKSSQLTAAGLEHSEQIAAYLWDSQVAAVVSDSPAVEVWPPDRSDSADAFGFLHQALIGRLGMPLGELWDLDALAADCREEGRYTMFLASAPLNSARGASSPANALAVK